MPAPVKVILIVMAALLVLAVILCALIAVVAFQLLFDREPPSYAKLFLKDFMGFRTGEEEIAAAAPGSILRWHADYYEKTEKEVLTAHSFDGLRLKADLFKGDPEKNRAVLYFHGFHGHPVTNSTGILEFWHQAGYSVLVAHQRGMNDSEGRRHGFGWIERRDVVTWARKMVRHFGEDCKLIIEGVSMGGASVMMASGEEDLPEQVVACVEDCGFSSVIEEFRHTYPKKLKWTYPAVVPFVDLYCRILNHYSLFKASSVEQLKKTRLPVFFLHGGEDNFVPTEMVYRCHEACPNYKELMVVPGAGHGEASAADPEGVKTRLRAFMEHILGSF